MEASTRLARMQKQSTQNLVCSILSHDLARRLLYLSKDGLACFRRNSMIYKNDVPHVFLHLTSVCEFVVPLPRSVANGSLGDSTPFLCHENHAAIYHTQ